MKKILVPTDYTQRSIDLAARAAKAIDTKIDIYLFHAFEMPDSLMDAMTNTHHNLITEELRVQCKRIKGQNANINHISFRALHGTTSVAFRNYAEANEIDLIVLPPEYKFIPVVNKSVNPLHMFRKSGIPILSDLTPIVKEKQVVAKHAAAHVS